MKAYLFLSATALVGSGIGVAPVYGQTATPTQAAASQIESPTSPAATIDGPDAADDQEITVTGSRIRVRNTIDAAIPIATITATELLGARGDISLGDAINQLPQLRSTFSQANSTAFIGTAGINQLDLRGLGTARTLTLLNGRRIVSASPGSYAPDINTLPFALIQQVDLITGGQSAIYGSDAIAGVVNFITRRDYEGTSLRMQGGVSKYGDRGNQLVSGLTGANFFEGRMNLTVAAEYSHADPFYFADRDYLGTYGGNAGFITSQITTAPNRNFDGIPNAVFVPRGIVFGNRSLGGTVVTSCPTATTAANAAQRAAICTGQNTPTGGALAYNFLFQNDGSLLRDSPTTTGLTDNRAIGGGVLFGGTATGREGAQLSPELDRFNANILLSGTISSAFKPFAEFGFTQVKAYQQSTQPSFTGGTLSGTASVNNPFLTPAARATLSTILPVNATTFTFNRFNNDLGTRAEAHTRRTYRGVIGIGGDIWDTANLRYEIAGNYGRTENHYRTGGNVLVANYNRAFNAVVAPASFTGSNFVLNSLNQRVVCAVNANTSATDDDANCVPLNLFGENRADPRAIRYSLYTSTRDQWAEQINATAFVSGDTSGLFKLPGGPIGFSLGGEYRREDAFSGQDPVTASGATFLNAAAIFSPPAIEIKEAYGEIRLPLLANLPLIHELTVEGAGRVSDYGGTTGSVWAWNASGIWAPAPDIRFRANYSRSVRAPNLGDQFATAGVTFVNGLSDPCDQPGGTNSGNNVTTNPNRARNCAAAGIPTTITFTDPASGASLTRPWTNQPTSGVAGVNRGNPDLVPEIGNSFTVGTIFTPRIIPGFTLKVDYYNIRVKRVISGLNGQTIINRCYDDPVGIDNNFCSAVFRRTSSNAVENLTFNGQSNRQIDQSQFAIPLAGDSVSFINQPFNFAKLSTRGIDVDTNYTKKFGDGLSINAHLIVSYVKERLSYSFITDPSRYDRLDQVLGDPRWQGQFSLSGTAGVLDVNYNARYVGKQIVSGLSYDTFFSVQGRPATNPDARPFVFYDPVVYHNFRIGINATKDHRFYFGVDNVGNELPPLDLTGVGSDAIYPNIGRFFYAGVEAKF